MCGRINSKERVEKKEFFQKEFKFGCRGSVFVATLRNKWGVTRLGEHGDSTLPKSQVKAANPELASDKGSLSYEVWTCFSYLSG